MRTLFTKVLGNPNEKAIKALQPMVAEINALETAVSIGKQTRRENGGMDGLDAYRRMPSVGEVVLLSQNEPLAEVFRRESGGEWEALLPVAGMGARLRLESIGCTVPLAEVYAGLQPAYAR